jgi:DNA-binding NtrC family response regulator
LSPVRKFKLSQAAHDFITDYPFLGNIRELRNMLERAILLADTDIVHISHLIEDSNEVQSEVNRKISKPNFHGEILPLNALESRYLQWAVGESNESKKDLASKLGLTTRTFYRKLNELKKETLN